MPSWQCWKKRSTLRQFGEISMVSRGANMTWDDRIAVDPDVLVGKPVIKGTRIAVEFVINLMAWGCTTEQILDEYDHLTAEDVRACLAYVGELLKGERVYPTPLAVRRA